MSGPFTVVIPARFDSSRLPGKTIADLGGRPMVVRTHDRALASGAQAVVVATDDERVRAAIEPFGVRAMLTSAAHPTGTDRVHEAVERLGLGAEAVVVNVQADEPLIPPAVIAQVAQNLLARPEADMATLCEPIETQEDLFDPANVKVVFDHRGMALYFSRAPIPWHRDAFAREPRIRPPGARHWRHVGIYAYRVAFLARYVALERPAVEEAEALEQLRALHHGAAIHVEPAVEPPGPGIDTPADLERARRLVAGERDRPSG